MRQDFPRLLRLGNERRGERCAYPNNERPPLLYSII
jgi:hypothetical protein